LKEARVEGEEKRRSDSTDRLCETKEEEEETM
jgi:hypothetical protein